MANIKHFPKIREARELLLAQAEELINLKMKIARDAMSKGDFETANKCVDWLLEHMPKSEGVTVIDPSIDKAIAKDSGPKGPQIQIGIALGGVNQKALPSSPVIDVKAIEAEDDPDTN